MPNSEWCSPSPREPHCRSKLLPLFHQFLAQNIFAFVSPPVLNATRSRTIRRNLIEFDLIGTGEEYPPETRKPRTSNLQVFVIVDLVEEIAIAGLRVFRHADKHSKCSQARSRRRVGLFVPSGERRLLVGTRPTTGTSWFVYTPFRVPLRAHSRSVPTETDSSWTHYR